MPPYLRLGSIPRKRHIAHRSEPGFQGEGIYYEEVVTVGRLRPGLQHRLPPAAADAGPQGRAGRDGRARARRRAGAAASPPQDRRDRPRRRPDHGPGAAAGQRRRDPRPLPARPSRRPSCSATPTPTRSSSSTAARGRCTRCSARCRSGRSTTSSSRAARPIGSSSSPAPSPTCSSSRRPATSTIPARYLNPDGQLRLGAPYSERDLHGPREVVADRPRGGDDRPDQGRPPADALHAGAATRSTSSAGTAWSIPTRSTPTTSSRSPARSTSRRRCSRRSTPPGSSSARSPRGCSTRIPRRSRCRTPTRTSQADEVLYYVRGRFGSRRGVEEASITLHPRGIPHGPHPGTIVASRDVDPDRRAGRHGRHRPAAPARRGRPSSWTTRPIP